MRTGGLEDVCSISLKNMDPTNSYDMFNEILRDSGWGPLVSFTLHIHMKFSWRERERERDKTER